MKATPASTPSPRLADVAPEFVVELERLLVWQGAFAIANQVSELTLLDRCRCGDSFCGSFLHGAATERSLRLRPSHDPALV
jgi:hypothetical protein